MQSTVTQQWNYQSSLAVYGSISICPIFTVVVSVHSAVQLMRMRIHSDSLYACKSNDPYRHMLYIAGLLQFLDHKFHAEGLAL